MTVEPQMPSKAPPGPPRRRIKNYLLDPRFQIKYVSMVVGVTVVVACVLGYFAYQYSKGQTEMMAMMQLQNLPDCDEKEPDCEKEFLDFIKDEAAKEDRKVLFGILLGIACLVLALGVTGIIVTHKLVGPAYKLRLLFRTVRDGHLRVDGGLRKGDELMDVFLAFEEMVKSLRSAQEHEVAQLSEAIEAAKKAGVTEDPIKEIIDVRDRMRETLE